MAGPKRSTIGSHSGGGLSRWCAGGDRVSDWLSAAHTGPPATESRTTRRLQGPA
ncbi:unnamed protein product, partial [Nesidiocoris tenuis]